MQVLAGKQPSSLFLSLDSITKIQAVWLYQQYTLVSSNIHSNSKKQNHSFIQTSVDDNIITSFLSFHAAGRLDVTISPSFFFISSQTIYLNTEMQFLYKTLQ